MLSVLNATGAAYTVLRPNPRQVSLGWVGGNLKEAIFKTDLFRAGVQKQSVKTESIAIYGREDVVAIVTALVLMEKRP